jgi:hypothetical protein
MNASVDPLGTFLNAALPSLAASYKWQQVPDVAMWLQKVS